MPLPFAVPALSRGYCALSPAARAAAGAAGEAVAPALREVLGLEVALAARPLPGPARDAAGHARVALALEALPALGALEVEAGLLAEVLARLSGAPGGAGRAAVPTAAEQSLLELLALVALAAARGPALDALAPRVVLGPAPAPDRGALAVHLELEVGGVRGAGRLLWPAAAVAALAPPGPPDGAAELPLGASLREGSCTLSPGDLAALCEGDVLLLDPPGAAELLFPGGLAVRGRRDGDRLLVEEVHMTETQAEFPITLAVELARVTVRLGDLARLEVGAALPLGIPAAGAVVLRAGERAVARGELVEIDGALGVRLAQVGGLP